MGQLVFHGYRWQSPQAYKDILDAMMIYARDVALEKACEAMWLLSHRPVYTLGANAPLPLLPALNIPVYRTGRGGLLTFHGPEQRMIYPFIRIKHRRLTIFSYLNTLEQWILGVLNKVGIAGKQVKERRGVWIGDKKICALGIQIKHNVAFHGMALNLYSPSHAFLSITPCGLNQNFGITSLEQLGLHVQHREIDALIWKACPFR